MRRSLFNDPMGATLRIPGIVKIPSLNNEKNAKGGTYQQLCRKGPESRLNLGVQVSKSTSPAYGQSAVAVMSMLSVNAFCAAEEARSRILSSRCICSDSRPVAGMLLRRLLS